MNRTNIYLSDEQRERLDARAHDEGVSRAELIRRLLDRALGADPDRLRSDLAAIDRSFGALDGDEIEFELDRGDGARGAHLERIAAR
jgi:hypothetical protein